MILCSTFDTGLIDLDVDSRSQECEKAKSSVAIISQRFQSYWMDFGVLLRLVWWNLCSCCRPFNVQGEDPSYVILLKKKTLWRWVVFRHLHSSFFQTWYDDRDHSAVHFDFRLDDLDLPWRSQLYEKLKIRSPFSHSLNIDLNEIQYVTKIC